MRLIYGIVTAVWAAMTAFSQTPPATSPPPSLPTVAAPAAGRPRQFDSPPGSMPYVHDPSTVIQSEGVYYVYTTGRGAGMLSSPDGVNWTRLGSAFPAIPEAVHAAVPKNDGTGVWAPDIIKVGDTFYMYYAVSSWGSFQSAVALVTNKTLDPKNPAYNWVDRGVVVSSDGTEDMNAIDPGVVMGPDGRMWICYGSYHGSIKVLELDPKTGLAKAGNPDKGKGTAIATARESEASDIIYRDGYYYLFVNHGSCCQGKTSQYNIRVGRAKDPTGPYLDKHGVALTRGGGSLFLAAHDHRIGPGHFGRVLEEHPESGLERFSLHYEADLTSNGRSTLGIRPLLWSVDGWPIAGDTLTDGVYQIVSQGSEDTLVVHTPMSTPPKPAPGTQPVPAVPTGPPDVRMSRYLAIDTEKWTISPVLATPFYKIVDLGTGTALTLSPDGSAALAPYTGADNQLWRLDQFTDGSYRIAAKSTKAALAVKDRGSVVAEPFVPDDAHRWLITTP